MDDNEKSLVVGRGIFLWSDVMPRKAKRPCRYRGCPQLTESESGYCETHERQIQYKWYRSLDKNYIRPPEYKKRYNKEWSRIRAAFLAANPLCEMCKRQGRYTLANEVHHIKPLANGGTNEFENLMALCKSCHSKITFAENSKKRGG